MDIKTLLNQASQAAQKSAEEELAALVAAGPKFSVHNADLAGNKGPQIGTMLDMCGGAWINVGGRERIVKMIKEISSVDQSYPPSYYGSCWSLRKGVYKGYHLSISFPLQTRQEASLHEAAMSAACKVLSEYAPSCTIHTYID